MHIKFWLGKRLEERPLGIPKRQKDNTETNFWKTDFEDGEVEILDLELYYSVASLLGLQTSIAMIATGRW